jgi:hypothetical protein
VGGVKWGENQCSNKAHEQQGKPLDVLKGGFHARVHAGYALCWLAREGTDGAVVHPWHACYLHNARGLMLSGCLARRVVVRRYDGDLSQAVSVQYRTKDGTAVAGLDFEGAAVSGKGHIKGHVQTECTGAYSSRWMPSALIHLPCCLLP